MTQACLRLFACAVVLLSPAILSAQSLEKYAELDSGNTFKLAFSPDGKWLAAVSFDSNPGRESTKTFRIWDVKERRQVVKFDVASEIPSIPDSIAISNAPFRVALAGTELQVWTVAGLPQNPEVKPYEFPEALDAGSHNGRLVFSADGNRLAALAWNRCVIWDFEARKTLSTFKWRVAPKAGVFSPDLRALAADNFQDVDLYDLASGKEAAAFLDHRGAVSCLAYRADGQALAVASCRSLNYDRSFTTIKIWDPGARKVIASFDETIGMPRLIALSQDGKTLLLQALGRPRLRLLDIPTRRWTDAAAFNAISRVPDCLVCSPAGDLVAVTFENERGKIQIWRLTSAREAP